MNINQKIEKIESELAEVKRELAKEEKWTPKIGEDYFYLDSFNEIENNSFDDGSFDNDLIQSGNFFQTEALAYSEKMRRESMKRDWLPKEGEKCWAICLSGNTFYNEKIIHTGNLELYYLGRIKKTEQEAQNWIDTYGKYWVEKE